MWGWVLFMVLLFVGLPIAWNTAREWEKEAEKKRRREEDEMPFLGCRQVPVRVLWALAQDTGYCVVGSWPKTDAELKEAALESLKEWSHSPVTRTGIAEFDLWVHQSGNVYLGRRIKSIVVSTEPK